MQATVGVLFRTSFSSKALVVPHGFQEDILQADGKLLGRGSRQGSNLREYRLYVTTHQKRERSSLLAHAHNTINPADSAAQLPVDDDLDSLVLRLQFVQCAGHHSFAAINNANVVGNLLHFSQLVR